LRVDAAQLGLREALHGRPYGGIEPKKKSLSLSQASRTS